MNLDQLEKKLIAAARANPPADTVPYAFEQRIMARLQSVRLAPPTWVVALWRAAAACAVIALLCAGWAYSPLNPGAQTDLSQDLEQTILASIDDFENSTW